MPVDPTNPHQVAFMRGREPHEHEWIEAAGDWDSPFEQVRCKICGCPGERYEDGEVYWPTT